MVQTLDSDGDGLLSLEDFVKLMEGEGERERKDEGVGRNF